MSQHEEPAVEDHHGHERPGYEDFIDLQAVIVRAIALTWSDEGFNKAYLDRPLLHIAEVYKDATGRALPCSHMSLTTAKSTKEANPHYFDPARTGGWVGKDDEVTFYLPPPPAEKNGRAAALTAYNQISPLGGIECSQPKPNK